MSEEIKFPYEPSDVVKKAFSNARKRRIAARVMIEEILDCLSNDDEGFAVLRKECPEMMEMRGDLTFNNKTQKVEMKE